MLDNTTKQKINTLRDILVGKVSDPKSQVEQITIAMFYKFMWDMDNELVNELGAKPKFFTGDFAKYSWEELFAPSLGGEEMLSLYKEAVEKMENNPNIPSAFRDIFRRAYLPYNDPSTLRMFLKVINDGFHYSHSEMLGDAFEYLLSILGTQGDAGQFRTPRHIIDFITECVNPQKGDIICDPSCGTAGFVISAYKHILKQNTDKTSGDKLSPSDKKKLGDNLIGLDIDPMMVKLALANMYLHGFNDPHIAEYDSLTNEDRWNDTYDVVLANPPFMTPKGGIRPHKRFTTKANRAEVLFVDLITSHLSANGRAGIVVPNGIVATANESAYKNLRKLIIKDSLVAVISLPANIFKPYSGVKTSILILDKKLNKQTDDILFIKVNNDGYELNEQRDPIDLNDLPNTITSLNNFKDCLIKGIDFSIENQEVECMIIKKETLLSNKEISLSINRYQKHEEVNTDYELVTLSDLLDYEQPTKYIVETVNYDDSYKTPVLTAGKSFIKGYTNEVNGIFDKLPVIIFDDFTTATQFVDFPFKVKSSAMKILKLRDEERSNIQFLFRAIQNVKIDSSEHRRYWISLYSQLQIPLPPIEIQEQIVAEIEGYQKIIDGARMVIDNYQPTISIKTHWEFTNLGSYCHFKRGPFGGSLKKEIFVKEGYLVYEQNHAINSDFTFGRYFITEEKFNSMEKFKVQDGDILISCSGTMGKIAIVPKNSKEGIINQALLRLRVEGETSNLFVKYYLESNTVQNRFFRNQEGAAIQNVASVAILKEIPFPKITLKEQEEIISEIEAEQEIVNSNKKLIFLYEQKIQKLIAQVWGQDE